MIDELELIANLIAACSHHTEHIVHKIDNNEDPMDDVILYNMAYKARQNAMKIFEEKYNVDKTWHCSIKHAISARCYIRERCDIDYNRNAVLEVQEYLIAVISKATGLEMEFCSRCFQDLLNEKLL